MEVNSVSLMCDKCDDNIDMNLKPFKKYNGYFAVVCNKCSHVVMVVVLPDSVCS